MGKECKNIYFGRSLNEAISRRIKKNQGMMIGTQEGMGSRSIPLKHKSTTVERRNKQGPQ